MVNNVNWAVIHTGIAKVFYSNMANDSSLLSLWNVASPPDKSYSLSEQEVLGGYIFQISQVIYSTIKFVLYTEEASS